MRAQGRFNRRAHIVSLPSLDVQPDELSPASGSDIDDAPHSLGIEHNPSSHLRLNGHVSVNAERRAVDVGSTVAFAALVVASVGAHGVVKLVGARNQQDSAHRGIVECRNEVA